MKKKWTADVVLEEFKEFSSSGEEITPKNLREKRNDLLVQIRRKFGSYRSFIETLGYNYEEVVGHVVWTKERIIKEIRTRVDSGLSVSRSDIEREDPKLLSAMVKHFGNFRQAIEACGHSYEDSIGFTWWTEEKVIERFLDIYHNATANTITKLREMDRGLDHAVRKHFGSYDKLCEKLGIDVTRIRPEVYAWSGDDLLRVLQDMRDSGEKLNVANVHTRFPSAVKVATREFGGFPNALAAIGEIADDHTDDRINTSRIGLRFEAMVRDMLSMLEPGLSYHFRGIPGIVPDFYNTNTREIVDAKLSSWSVFNCDTVEKYIPHCTQLKIIYLRGPMLEHSVDGLTLIPIDRYYPRMRENGLCSMVDRFEALKRDLEIPECVTTPEIIAA